MHYEALFMRLTNSCEPWRWSGLWLMLGGGKGKELHGESAACLKSPGRQGSLSREPSQELPWEAGSPSPHSPAPAGNLTPRSMLPCWSVPLKYGFTHNMWVKDTSNKWQPPRTRSGHHLEREASLGISHSSCRVTFACLSYSSSQKKSLSFSRHSEDWKKKTKNQHNSRQSTYVIISAFTRALQCVSDYGWKFVLFSLSCNLCLLLTTSLNTWQKAENLPFLTDQVLASTNETIMDLHISFKGVNIWTGIIKTKKSILFLKCVSDFHGGQLDNFLLLLN